MTDGTGFRASGTALCLAGALTGYVAGADVVQLLLGAEYRPSPEVAALVAGLVGAAVTTQLVGQSLVTGAKTAMWRVSRSAPVQEVSQNGR